MRFTAKEAQEFTATAIMRPLSEGVEKSLDKIFSDIQTACDSKASFLIYQWDLPWHPCPNWRWKGWPLKPTRKWDIEEKTFFPDNTESMYQLIFEEEACLSATGRYIKAYLESNGFRVKMTPASLSIYWN